MPSFLCNDSQLQETTSVRCGYYCLLFLNERNKGTSYENILKMFSNVPPIQRKNCRKLLAQYTAMIMIDHKFRLSLLDEVKHALDKIRPNHMHNEPFRKVLLLEGKKAWPFVRSTDRTCFIETYVSLCDVAKNKFQ